MFRARLKLSEQSTLERRYEFHVGEAARATLLGDREKAAGHSATALLITRELYVSARESARHRAMLAAALAAHARYERSLESLALLTESAAHYAVLAEAEPHQYETERIGVLVRVALTVEAAGNPRDAMRLLSEAIGMYRQTPAADRVARAAGLARACFHLGRCLTQAGRGTEALAYTDEGLRAANLALRELLRESRRSTGGPDARPGPGEMSELNALSQRVVSACCRADARDAGWLSRAPRQVQLLAPDWMAAATRAMTLHAAAGHWPAAATAACAAVRVSGALAAFGGEDRQEAHVAVLGRARSIWTRARTSGVPHGSHRARHAPQPASAPARA